MEKGETLEIFVCETFIVGDGPKLVPSTPYFSTIRLSSPVAFEDLISGSPWLGARPPTVLFYQVRTKMAVAI